MRGESDTSIERVSKFKVKRSRSSGQGRMFMVKRSLVKVKVIRSRSEGQSHVSGAGFAQRGCVELQGQ
jgi:hypothetical protein